MANHCDLKELFGPKKDYPYFARGARHPFLPRSSRFEMANAGWLADASLLVYVPDPNWVTTCLQQNGGLRAECVGFGVPGVQYVVAYNEDFVIVSFRGTEVHEWGDLLTDAQCCLEDWEQGGHVHAGFKKALDGVWDKLSRTLSTLSKESGGKRTVWFTGHSLGAALATLAADRYAPTWGMYTFGSPRVGDKGFAEDFHVNAYRFVNNNDIVTRVPPPVLYWHVGNLMYIDRDGEIEDNPGRWNRLEDSVKGCLSRLIAVSGHWREGYLGAIGWDDLADHAPAAYADKIWKQV